MPPRTAWVYLKRCENCKVDCIMYVRALLNACGTGRNSMSKKKQLLVIVPVSKIASLHFRFDRSPLCKRHGTEVIVNGWMEISLSSITTQCPFDEYFRFKEARSWSQRSSFIFLLLLFIFISRTLQLCERNMKLQLGISTGIFRIQHKLFKYF